MKNGSGQEPAESHKQTARDALSPRTKDIAKTSTQKKKKNRSVILKNIYQKNTKPAMYQKKKTIKKLTLTRVQVKRGVDNSRIRLERERGRVIERCFDISNVTTVRQPKREVLMRVHCGALFIWHGQTGPHGDRSNHLVRLVASSTRE